MSNYYIRLYASNIIPLKEGDKITDQHWLAMTACDKLGSYLAKLLNGKTDCSSCGTVQYTDRVKFEQPLSDATIKWLNERFPFVSTYRAKGEFV